jgi:hypothetical protein
MGFLDDYLLGRNRERSNLDNSVLRDTVNAKVTRFTPQGVQFQGVDRRASSRGAATALLRTTGSIPPGFFNNDQGGLNNIISFDNVGGDTFKQLQNDGIQEGSLVSDLFKSLQNNGNSQINASNQTNNRISNSLNNTNVSNNASQVNSPDDDVVEQIRERLNVDDNNNRRRRNGSAPFGSRGGRSGVNGSEAGIDPRNFSNTTGTFLSSFIEDLFNLDSGDPSAIDNLSDDNQNFSGSNGRDLRFLRGR